jgi:hypothetical protein
MQKHIGKAEKSNTQAQHTALNTDAKQHDSAGADDALRLRPPNSKHRRGARLRHSNLAEAFGSLRHQNLG